MNEVVVFVEPEVVRDPEARTHGRGQEPRAGCSADECERGTHDLYGTCVETRVHGNIDLEVFHCGVDELFYSDGEPMDLVDEQDVPRLKTCEHRDEIGAACERRSRCDVYLGSKFRPDHMGEGCLPKTGWAVEEDVLEVLARLGVVLLRLARFDRFDRDEQALDELGLSDVLIDGLWTQGPVLVLLRG